MAKKRRRRLAVCVGTSVWVGVWTLLGGGGGTTALLGVGEGEVTKGGALARRTTGETTESADVGEWRTSWNNRGNEGMGGNVRVERDKRIGWDGRVLAAPAAETRLSVRDLRPGDLLAARWAEEKKNGTPGFWNHLAIVGTNGASVVEAQKTADGVVTATVEDFLARYADVSVFRFFDAKTARRAAEAAESRVAVEAILTPPLRPEREKKGRTATNEEEWDEFNDKTDWRSGEETGDKDAKRTRASGPRYSWSASLAPVLRDDAAAENCVSLVRRAFRNATGVDYRWKTPDDLARWDKSGDFAKIGRF